MLIHRTTKQRGDKGKEAVYVHRTTDHRFASEVIRLHSMALSSDKKRPANRVNWHEHHDRNSGLYAIACNEPTKKFWNNHATSTAISEFDSTYQWNLLQHYGNDPEFAEEKIEAMLRYGHEEILKYSTDAAVSATTAFLRAGLTNRLLRKYQTTVTLGNMGTGMAFIARGGEVLEEDSLTPQGFYGTDFQWNMGKPDTHPLLSTAELQKGDRIFLASPTIAENPQELSDYVSISDPVELAMALVENRREELYSKIAYVATI